jgi:hypothetical protein
MRLVDLGGTTLAAPRSVPGTVPGAVTKARRFFHIHRSAEACSWRGLAGSVPGTGTSL